MFQFSIQCSDHSSESSVPRSNNTHIPLIIFDIIIIHEIKTVIPFCNRKKRRKKKQLCKDCVQLAQGVSQIQLLCLHAVVQDGNCFWKSFPRTGSCVQNYLDEIEHHSMHRQVRWAVFSRTLANAHSIPLLWRPSLSEATKAERPP